MNRTRTELTEMEAAAGLRVSDKNDENILSQNSLNHIQQVLSKSEVLLSYHLGDDRSYVWAVTRDDVRVYGIAPAAEIKQAITSFRDAVRAGTQQAARLGEEVFGMLFSVLSQVELEKTDWKISADGVLFAAPLAALVTRRRGSYVTYLVEKHSLQLVPGAMSLAGGPPKPAGGEWIGVGDPIYNSADPRWPRRRTLWSWSSTAGNEQLNRLVGSSEELHLSARSWGSNSVVLEGVQATRTGFEKSMARQPAVIHLATHVLAGVERPEETMIALGLDGAGQSQVLTTVDIALLQVPGAVVTMSGCATGVGAIRAGAGLIGMTRAWQIAGANTVIATLWPVPDSNGELFANFYRYLRQMPATEALRESQVDMIRSATWRSSPQYWAAYQATGGAR